ncbi:hypothetical protein TNIN_96651 [Trichonephila inaurata madagascariensis]|uniref:Reverse transcriptase domain-containing protein n=1 Tax=Trichonephila inaurata madagascariensis TaxID=2747483 RepID=A0A8X6XPT3_9ARAC|nr:hypothetical protein TNIN_96651 [Trichonephila inaurata madagascariensis]
MVGGRGIQLNLKFFSIGGCFGLSCSPYLLGATIRFHLQNVPLILKNSNSVVKVIYVDNCVTSVDDAEELENLSRIQNNHSTAKFELGWEHSYSDRILRPFTTRRKKLISVLGLKLAFKDGDSLTMDLQLC